MGSFSHRPRQARYRMMSEINVTPFVDVMLVLLIVFMVTAPLLTAGVAVNLPRTEAKNLTGSDTPLIISINADGDIFLQESAIALEDLLPRLRAILTNQTADAPRIFVRGDRNTSYGNVAALIAHVTAAGYSRVALITEQSKNVDIRTQ